MPDPEKPPEPEMSDDKVDKLVTHVLDKMGVSGIPERELAMMETEQARQRATEEQGKAVQGQMDALKMLVKALQDIAESTRSLGNGMSKMAADIDIIKRMLKRGAKPGKLSDALEASESVQNLEAPPKKL